jgi:hypothetical protein
MIICTSVSSLAVVSGLSIVLSYWEPVSLLSCVMCASQSAQSAEPGILGHTATVCGAVLRNAAAAAFCMVSNDPTAGEEFEGSRHRAGAACLLFVWPPGAGHIARQGGGPGWFRPTVGVWRLPGH